MLFSHKIIILGFFLAQINIKMICNKKFVNFLSVTITAANKSQIEMADK